MEITSGSHISPRSSIVHYPQQVSEMDTNPYDLPKIPQSILKDEINENQPIGLSQKLSLGNRYGSTGGYHHSSTMELYKSGSKTPNSKNAAMRSSYTQPDIICYRDIKAVIKKSVLKHQKSMDHISSYSPKMQRVIEDMRQKHLLVSPRVHSTEDLELQSFSQLGVEPTCQQSSPEDTHSSQKKLSQVEMFQLKSHQIVQDLNSIQQQIRIDSALQKYSQSSQNISSNAESLPLSLLSNPSQLNKDSLKKKEQDIPQAQKPIIEVSLHSEEIPSYLKAKCQASPSLCSSQSQSPKQSDNTSLISNGAQSPDFQHSHQNHQQEEEIEKNQVAINVVHVDNKQESITHSISSSNRNSLPIIQERIISATGSPQHLKISLLKEQSAHRKQDHVLDSSNELDSKILPTPHFTIRRSSEGSSNIINADFQKDYHKVSSFEETVKVEAEVAERLSQVKAKLIDGNDHFSHFKVDPQSNQRKDHLSKNSNEHKQQDMSNDENNLIENISEEIIAQELMNPSLKEQSFPNNQLHQSINPPKQPISCLEMVRNSIEGMSLILQKSGNQQLTQSPTKTRNAQQQCFNSFGSDLDLQQLVSEMQQKHDEVKRIQLQNQLIETRLDLDSNTNQRSILHSITTTPKLTPTGGAIIQFPPLIKTTVTTVKQGTKQLSNGPKRIRVPNKTTPDYLSKNKEAIRNKITGSGNKPLTGTPQRDKSRAYQSTPTPKKRQPESIKVSHPQPTKKQNEIPIKQTKQNNIVQKTKSEDAAVVQKEKQLEIIRKAFKEANRQEVKANQQTNIQTSASATKTQKKQNQTQIPKSYQRVTGISKQQNQKDLSEKEKHLRSLYYGREEKSPSRQLQVPCLNGDNDNTNEGEGGEAQLTMIVSENCINQITANNK